MKVIFVCSGNNPHFETAPFIRAQAESLVRAGLTVDFYAIRGKGVKGYLKHVDPLRRVLRSGNYDIVHAHYAYCGWVARLASSGLPLAVSLMGSDTYGSVNRKGRLRLKSLPVILQSGLLNFFVDTIIVKSDNLLRYVLLKKKAHVIPNGVDFEVFQPADKGIAREHLSLDPEKVYVLFAGNPDDPRKNILMAREAIAGCSHPEGITLLTPWPVPHHEMVNYYNAADLLLHPSWMEGSPNVIKEALVCNCNVVATPAGDTASLLEGVSGSKITPWNVQAITDAVQELIDTPARCNGREVHAELDSNLKAQKLIRIYERIRKNNR
jgi:teichuronic acid biosynthesis glycosyltransferase TuaC